MILRTDHPHACGDKCHRGQICRYKQGSSPRVWGQVVFFLYFSCFLRIIPTRVGTRLLAAPHFLLSADHPHACGDKASFDVVPIISIGSSPRVWGQVLATVLSFLPAGIIPTRVGTRRVYSTRLSFQQDHPHAYGDKLYYLSITESI